MPKPLPPGLSIRQALPQDIFSIASLLASAPDDGTIYTYSSILDRPNEWQKLHIFWLRPAIYDPTSVIRVAILPQDGEDVVVGFSSWAKREATPLREGKTRIVEIGKTNWADCMYLNVHYP
jgi:hypothetical protein